MVWAYLQAWLLTVTLETPVVAALFPGQRLRMDCVCVVATTITHAAMHFLLPLFAPTLEAWITAGEIGATVVEATMCTLLARPPSLPRSVVAAALANSLSYAVGLAVFD